MIPYFTNIYGLFLILGTLGFFTYLFPKIIELIKEEIKKPGHKMMINPTKSELKKMIKEKDWKRVWKGFPSRWEGNT